MLKFLLSSFALIVSWSSFAEDRFLVSVETKTPEGYVQTDVYFCGSDDGCKRIFEKARQAPVVQIGKSDRFLVATEEGSAMVDLEGSTVRTFPKAYPAECLTAAWSANRFAVLVKAQTMDWVQIYCDLDDEEATELIFETEEKEAPVPTGYEQMAEQHKNFQCLRSVEPKMIRMSPGGDRLVVLISTSYQFSWSSSAVYSDGRALQPGPSRTEAYLFRLDDLEDRGLTIWTKADPVSLTPSGYEGDLKDCSFSPDGARLVLIGEEYVDFNQVSTVFEYDGKTGTPAGRLKGSFGPYEHGWLDAERLLTAELETNYVIRLASGEVAELAEPVFPEGRRLEAMTSSSNGVLFVLVESGYDSKRESALIHLCRGGELRTVAEEGTFPGVIQQGTILR